MKISKKKLFLLKSYFLMILLNKNFFKIQKKYLLFLITYVLRMSTTIGLCKKIHP
jgi:hypothetical protein